MKNKLILTLIVSMFLISLVSANQIATLGTFKQNECIELKQSCADCSYVNFSRVSYPDGTRAMNNTVATKDGSIFNLEFCNTDQLGTYIVEGIGDVEGTDTVFAYDFEVTFSGSKLSELSISANFLLFSFFIILILSIYSISNKVNYESWYKSIINKYQNKNYIKLVLSSIAYNIMKNIYIIYYLIGFPLILIILDISYKFGITSMVDILQTFLFVYVIGALVVGIYFFGYAQEWLMDLLNKVNNMDWGIE
jgi:hypothetical protein